MKKQEHRQKSGLSTEKQERYVDARSSGLDKQDALAVAGYTGPPSVATELENMPSIKKALSAEYRKNQYMLGITREEVLRGMKEAVDQAKILADPMTQVAAWREIGKIIGCYAPEVRKIELTANSKRFLEGLEQLSDAELLELASSDVLEGEFEEVKH